ncbi:CAS/CSE protein involved in chromosome segregation [Microbacterium sp. TS-1]|uniref:DUF4012 domain-containing protein n=1 Tax=Microbacterium sp. TS-1 TaxID=1344956 RepID=UPI00038FA1A2|nr:DUF4012 domain-containing protein [Microbacterium sp. TS-1]GAD35046.1 CAS/CSE protein involved in chromosome segregation [Microbacterium sp. TS-1]
MPEETRRNRQKSRTRKQKRPLLRSFRLWVPVGVLVLIIAVGVVGGLMAKGIADRAFAARDALQSAIPLASTAKEQVLASDTDGAQSTVARLKELTAEARAQADGDLWRFGEVVPVAGQNLTAVREVAETIDDLVVNALEPASGLSLSSLAPKEGRIDVVQLDVASDILDRAASSLAEARATVDGIDQTALVEQVASGVAQLDDALAQIEPIVEPAQKTLSVLPGILGAEGPRNYLVLVQNNAESRGTGGNPASLVMITADNGSIAITQQASSTDFNNGRANPIVELDPAAVALYGDKIGRYMQDVTTTPDFPDSARIMGAFWQEQFGTRIDGTLSIDPVALSYIMNATGAVTLPNGDNLDSSNVVSSLLNEVYFRYSNPLVQDAYFAAAAGAVFDSITSVSNPRALVDQVARAADEGRILYVPTSPAEAEIIAGSRMTGQLPSDNSEITMVGSYVNDITEGKLDYYMDTAVAVSSDVCSVDASTSPSFTVSSSLTSTLQPGDVDDLARYISPAKYFPKGVISTDLVLYGPVGATFTSAAVDGNPVNATPIEHLGRPAVKINVVNDPATSHTVTANFTGAADQPYGPIQVWHTPMVRDTPVAVDAPGCAG